MLEVKNVNFRRAANIEFTYNFWCRPVKFSPYRGHPVPVRLHCWI